MVEGSGADLAAGEQRRERRTAIGGREERRDTRLSKEERFGGSVWLCVS
jgi:hypothetical protein